MVYSSVYSGADQRKQQSSASLAFVWGIHQWPVNSPHKWPVTRKIFPFDDAIMADWMPAHKPTKLPSVTIPPIVVSRLNFWGLLYKKQWDVWVCRLLKFNVCYTSFTCPCCPGVNINCYKTKGARWQKLLDASRVVAILTSLALGGVDNMCNSVVSIVPPDHPVPLGVKGARASAAGIVMSRFVWI